MAQRIETMVFSLWSNPESNRGNGGQLSQFLADGWRITNRGETVASQSGLSAPSTTQTIELQRVVEVADDTAAGTAMARTSSSRRASSASAGPAAVAAVAVHPDFDMAAFGRHYAAAMAGAGAGVASGFGGGGGGGSGFPGHHQVQQRPFTRSDLRRVTLTERWNWLTAAQRAEWGDVDSFVGWHQGVARGEIVEGRGAVVFDGRSAT